MLRQGSAISGYRKPSKRDPALVLLSGRCKRFEHPIQQSISHNISLEHLCRLTKACLPLADINIQHRTHFFMGFHELIEDAAICPVLYNFWHTRELGAVDGVSLEHPRLFWVPSNLSASRAGARQELRHVSRIVCDASS